MRLKNIKISGLFGLFSYDIEINQEEDLTILTSPNGYGKTTVLNILYSLFNGRFYYFQKLLFKRIVFYFDNQYRLEVTKINLSTPPAPTQKVRIRDVEMDDEQSVNSTIELSLFDHSNKNVGIYEYTAEKEEGIKNQIRRYIPFLNRHKQNQWIDMQNNRMLKFDDILNEYSSMLPSNVFSNFTTFGMDNDALLDVLNNFLVYLIKEQRLIRPPQERRNSDRDVQYTNTIKEYAKELSDIIRNKQVESLNITQQLDSTFPKRLLESTEKLTQKDFIERFEALKNKFEKLHQFGLLTTSLDVPPYNENDEDARVLTVYLSDSEKKTAVFDDLLSKIELFTNILNQKRFVFKHIQIDKDNGFVFNTNYGQPISLTDLSSGEQHEVVLLYELLFKVQPNTLVLIDEPEISLHVSWQHAFIDDLIKIAEMQQIRFIIATHSPMIINNRFDLSVDLFDLTQKQKQDVDS